LRDALAHKVVLQAELEAEIDRLRFDLRGALRNRVQEAAGRRAIGGLAAGYQEVTHGRNCQCLQCRSVRAEATRLGLEEIVRVQAAERLAGKREG
jgi:hypothetical protein